MRKRYKPLAQHDTSIHHIYDMIPAVLQVARFLPNPEANWGPKPKHTRTGRVRPTLCPTI